nr:hypothetical protein [Lachnospiraceae bacterium]
MRRLGFAGRRILAAAISAVMIAGTSLPTAAAYTVDVSAGIAGSKVSVTVEDENVQENAAEDTAGVVTAGDSDEGSIVAGAAASGEDSLEAVSDGEVSTIEINQGLSYHTGLNDGNETYINDFVAKKTTAIFAKLPGTEGKTETEARNTYTSLKLEAKAVTNGQESD